MSVVIDQTSEEEFGLMKQPPPTCPMIDSAISVVEKCGDHLRGYERMSEEEMREALSSIESDLSELAPLRRRWGYGSRNGILEEIRENAGAIRSWGQDWKDHAKSLATLTKQPAEPSK